MSWTGDRSVSTAFSGNSVLKECDKISGGKYIFELPVNNKGIPILNYVHPVKPTL